MYLVALDDVVSSPIDIMSKLVEYYINIDNNRVIFGIKDRHSLKYTMSKYEGEDTLRLESLRNDITSDLNNLMMPFFEEYEVLVEVVVDEESYTVAFDITAIVDGYPYKLSRVMNIINGNIKDNDVYLDALEKHIRRL